MAGSGSNVRAGRGSGAEALRRPCCGKARATLSRRSPVMRHLLEDWGRESSSLLARGEQHACGAPFRSAYLRGIHGAEQAPGWTCGGWLCSLGESKDGDVISVLFRSTQRSLALGGGEFAEFARPQRLCPALLNYACASSDRHLRYRLSVPCVPARAMSCAAAALLASSVVVPSHGRNHPMRHMQHACAAILNTQNEAPPPHRA